MDFTRFLLLAALPLLSGCLLPQAPPPPSSNNKQVELKALGILRLTDHEGDQAIGTFEARFMDLAKKEELWAIPKPEDGARCRLVKPSEGETYASGLLPAGRIGFGPVFQEGMTLVQSDARNFYFRPLESHVGAGVYGLQVEGSSSIPTLGTDRAVYLAMPEGLRKVRFTSNGPSGGVLEIQKGSDLSVAWKATAVPNLANIIVIEVASQEQGRETRLRCEAVESIFTRSSEIAVTIPASMLQDLPSSVEAEVRLMRAQALGFRDNGVYLQTIGMRRYSHRAVLVDGE